MNLNWTCSSDRFSVCFNMNIQMKNDLCPSAGLYYLSHSVTVLQLFHYISSITVWLTPRPDSCTDSRVRAQIKHREQIRVTVLFSCVWQETLCDTALSAPTTLMFTSLLHLWTWDTIKFNYKLTPHTHTHTNKLKPPVYCYRGKK